MIIKNRLGDILAERGTKKKWLCDKTGISYQALSNHINGIYGISLLNALRIAKVLGLRVEDIWQLEEDEEEI